MNEEVSMPGEEVVIDQQATFGREGAYRSSSATTASMAPVHSDCLRKRELVSAGIHAPMDGQSLDIASGYALTHHPYS
ncbi:hypothetical protein [Bradyrhizobium ottawaense]|uniref:hypothetical protein n=1 Tax=Bradyrhizobium ottawaense TaxID=931866 RepID=UPI00384E3683